MAASKACWMVERSADPLGLKTVYMKVEKLADAMAEVLVDSTVECSVDEKAAKKVLSMAGKRAGWTAA